MRWMLIPQTFQKFGTWSVYGRCRRETMLPTSSYFAQRRLKDCNLRQMQLTVSVRKTRCAQRRMRYAKLPFLMPFLAAISMTIRVMLRTMVLSFGFAFRLLRAILIFASLADLNSSTAILYIRGKSAFIVVSALSSIDACSSLNFFRPAVLVV
ncbi:hypothetical protein L228DRAFT_167519 [Xylona heveae TC161]|uniref:Uncharacterized protein n=1 Tax=Xylona heveae (strain CBS 132557 / TC161) TaxID=1328760 RepID=A0A165FMS8_XYLHT|nr:hypothetical protein L228DRAFT_167519 [Xylona heveae TC161]KZF21168.1 hypothetical protein L228DRAFT_167519 [Xylona heveae TC161]